MKSKLKKNFKKQKLFYAFFKDMPRGRPKKNQQTVLGSQDEPPSAQKRIIIDDDEELPPLNVLDVAPADDEPTSNVIEIFKQTAS
jgi:hypothetical protein